MIELLCVLCKQVKEIAHTDHNDLSYCADCAATIPVPPEVAGMAYLLATIPFRVGDRVTARTAGVYLDGIGVIDEISFDFERTGGTLVYPAFHVTITDPASPDAPADGWYTEVCLTCVKEVEVCR